jgi:aconitate hydratase
LFRKQYANVYNGNETWNAIKGTEGSVYRWDDSSTYVQEPPFFQDFSREPGHVQEINGTYVLALLGDSITTDHISPASDIPVNSPAGRYLMEKGIEKPDFNSYGARRGNHEVMMRGTFANIRLRNQLVPGSEGGVTIHFPTTEVMSIYDAAMKYIADETPLVVLAGAEYGTGSSRDWAAKGTALLGVKAVIAQSFERIHRSNLVMMGVLPLQFKSGESWQSLELTGRERYDILGLSDGLKPQQDVTVRATSDDGSVKTFQALARIDTPVEVEYYQNGGILQTVLRNFLKQ